MIKLETLLNNDGEYVKNYILSLDNDLRKNLLKNEKIYKFFLEDKNHYPFIWLIQELKDEEDLKVFFSNDLKKIINNSKIVDKVNALMNLDLNIKNEILNKDEFIDLIIKNSSLHIYIDKLNGKITESIFNKIIEENKINLLKKLNKNDYVQNLNDLFLIESSKRR